MAHFLFWKSFLISFQEDYKLLISFNFIFYGLLSLKEDSSFFSNVVSQSLTFSRVNELWFLNSRRKIDFKIKVRRIIDSRFFIQWWYCISILVAPNERTNNNNFHSIDVGSTRKKIFNQNTGLYLYNSTYHKDQSSR